jgi:Fic family protein
MYNVGMPDNERAYRTSHPFISFEIDMRRCDPLLWLLLGEAQSKCDHISGVPLRPQVADDLHLLYLVKGVQATTAIEGNTLTEGEVKQIVDGTSRIPQSKEYLAQEVQNIIDACNLVSDSIATRVETSLTVERIREFNRLVLKGLELPEHAVPGETRKCSVGVGTYRAAPWEDCDYLLERLVEWLDGPTFEPPSTSLEIAFAVLKAIVAHLYIAWIHPFGDGNGRTARLVELQILLSAGVSTPSSHLLSNHYNQTRSEYYRQLDRASATNGEIVPFIKYGVEGFVDGLRSQLELVRQQQLDVAWEAHVHDVFDGAKSSIAVRRRHLVLDLARLGRAVPLAKLGTISPRVATDYAKVSPRTMWRDAFFLARKPHTLLRFTKDGVVANKALIQAFLPIRRPEGPREKVRMSRQYAE